MASHKPAYKRILLKLSGESLLGPAGFGIDFDRARSIAREIKDVRALGVQVAIMIGGGNIFRGARLTEAGMDRASADQMGLLATVIYGIALHHSRVIRTAGRGAGPICGTTSARATRLSLAGRATLDRRRAGWICSQATRVARVSSASVISAPRRVRCPATGRMIQGGRTLAPGGTARKHGSQQDRHELEECLADCSTLKAS